jgi:hypothetical protein
VGIRRAAFYWNTCGAVYGRWAGEPFACKPVYVIFIKYEVENSFLFHKKRFLNNKG